MGDGQHIWAAAEWALMIRNLFVREEADRLIIGSGIFPRWLHAGKTISFGPTLTHFGSISVSLRPEENNFQLIIASEWFAQPQTIQVRVPGFVATQTGKPNVFLITPQPGAKP